MSKKGVLLINIGTPKEANKSSVAKYLIEFLSDPRVIDIPPILRWLLVHCIIVPLRAGTSAKAYQQIWTTAGSPLLTHSQALCAALQHALGDQYKVVLGMRYGSPGIQTSLAMLDDCDEISILPLFPQYSSAATGSAIEKCLKMLSDSWNMPTIKVLRDFYDNDQFISSYARIIEDTIGKKSIDLLLFSYHGLPERHIYKSNCKAACDKTKPCPTISVANQWCYRAQCYQTSRLLADKLAWAPNKYEVAFQSRLGRTPWIKPYTDLLLPDLIKKGIKNIAVVCPSFTVDCLETLEEINIRARNQWKALGGHEFIFIPCLNSHPDWVQGLAHLINPTFGAPHEI